MTASSFSSSTDIAVRGRRARRAVAGVLVSFVSGVVLAPPAQATTIDYVGTATSSSLIVLHKGDQYQRKIVPSGTIKSTIDTNGSKVSNISMNFAPAWTPIEVVSGLPVYTKTELEPLPGAYGSFTPSSQQGVVDMTINSTSRMHVTVYLASGSTPHPDTDTKLSDGAKCWVDLSLSLSGTSNGLTGATSLGVDRFAIPNFPGPPTATSDHTCGLGTFSLNQRVAGSNNSIQTNFAGGGVKAHYTGKLAGTSTIDIRKGDPATGRTVKPSGTMVSDIDFVKGTISNITTVFDPIDMSAAPGTLASFPVYAHVTMTQLAPGTGTLTPSGTTGISNVTSTSKVRMAVTVSAVDKSRTLTDPKTCYVDLSMSLTGTNNGGNLHTDLNSKFTIPSFPASGCNGLSASLTGMISGSNNYAALHYVDQFAG